MAQVNKISSFKSFTEVKNQEATLKLRETNNAKRQETVGKIGAILDEMGLTSLSELDEVKKQALINKMFGNVSEDEAEDIEDEINKLGEPKKLEERNAFLGARAKAIEEDKTEFEFNGKTYKVKVNEGNAFGDAVRKAKEAGEKEFEFDGKTYKVEEGNAFGDAVRKAKEDGEEEFEFDGKTFKVEEALNAINEGRVKAATLLQELIDGNTSRAEGIKMSKDLAEHYLYWLRTSPYGKKNADLPLYMLIKASFVWGIERQLDPKLKVELEALKGSIKESVDFINEARTIAKIQYDWSKLTTTMAATAQNWKTAEGPAKEMLLGKLKEMTAQKKGLETELDAAIADKDKDIELVVSEAFFRLPKDVIGNELYMATQNLANLYGSILAGNDVDAGVIDTVIKALTTVKKSVKKFNNKEEVLGTVYEGEVNEADMTKFYDGFKVLDDKTGKMTKFHYVKGRKNTDVENEAIAKLMKATGSSRANFGVHGFVKKGEWNMDKTPVFESTVNEADSVKSEAISRLADFFRISPYALSKFNFDGNDNIKELTKVLNSTSDEGTKLYYDTCIKLAKKDLGINESTVNEAEKFKSTQDFEEFLEEIDGMPEVRIKRIMGKDYIDTPGGFRDEADDYDNDIVEYTLSNMGRKDFEALKAWWENNVQESLTEGMISPKMANSFKIGNKIKTQKDTYTITGFGSKTGATRDFEAENENGEQFNLRVSLKGATGIQVAVGARNLNFPEQQEMLESVVTEAAAKQFDVDFTSMVRNIKSGYGWIDPEYVADTWENSSDSIDFELVKGEIYKRLIAAGLLAYADDEDEEVAGKYVKSLKELGIKESFVNEAVSNPSELTSFINKNESHFAAFLKPKKINTSVEGNKAIIKPASGSFTITVDFDKSTIDSTGKPKNPESTSYVEIIEYIKGNTKFKVLNESAEVNEAEVKSDDEFKEYAMTVLKKAFGDDFDEAKATEVVDGILKKCGDDYGACVGMLTSSLGESVVTEAFDANYWEDYQEGAQKTKNPTAMVIMQDVQAAVEEWNDNNENGVENEVTPAGEKKVLKLAKEFVKAKGYISFDIIDAMIAQES